MAAPAQSQPLLRQTVPWTARVSDAVWTRALLGMTFLAMLPCVLGDFVWDDTGLILVNPWMSRWSSAWALVSHDLFATGRAGMASPSNYYRPVFLLWLLLLNKVSGSLPGIFHLANILLHLAVVMLVIAITRRVTRDRAVALLAGALFALHPIHAEAVAWISGGTEPLCAVFVLGSVLAFLRSEDAGARRGIWFAFSVLLFALGLFEKETAIITPAALLLYLCAKPELRGAEKFRRISRTMVPYALVTGVYLVVRIHVLGHFAESRLSSPAAAWREMPLRFAWYMRQLLWPFHLSVSYKPLPHLATTASVSALLFFAGVAVVLVWKLRRSPGWALLGSLSFLALCPVLIENFTGLHDRFLYLPSLAFCVVLATLIMKLPQPALRTSAVAALLVIGAVGVVREERVWRSDVSLFERAMEVNYNPATVIQLASYYGEAGDTARQSSLLEHGLQSFPESAQLWWARGTYDYFTGKQWMQAEVAFEKSQQYAKTQSIWAEDECMLGAIDTQRGQMKTAEEKLRAGLAAESTLQTCRSNLATVLASQGRAEEAQAERNRAAVR